MTGDNHKEQRIMKTWRVRLTFLGVVAATAVAAIGGAIRGIHWDG